MVPIRKRLDPDLSHPNLGTASQQAEEVRDLVLGTAEGYDCEDIRPFVESLRATGFDGEVRLFVSRLSLRTLEKLAEFQEQQSKLQLALSRVREEN